MAKARMKLNERFTFKRLMQIELLIASMIPATAILALGLLSTKRLGNMSEGHFLLLLIGGAFIIFIGECLVIIRMQRVTRGQLAGLTYACREFMLGNKDRRVLIKGDDELATLVSTLNALLDQQQNIALSALKDDGSTSTSTMQINTQLTQLVAILSPALSGDLRVRADVSRGSISAVAELCNALIEKLTQFTRWTLYASDRVEKTSSNLLLQAQNTVQTNTILLYPLSHVDGTVEKLAKVMRQMNANLQSGLDIAREVHLYLQGEQEKLAISTFSGEEEHGSGRLKQLVMDTSRQQKLLKDAVQTVRDTIGVIEVTQREIKAFTQKMQEAQQPLHKITDYAQSMFTLAEGWTSSAKTLYLPIEEAAGEVALEEHQIGDILSTDVLSTKRKRK